MVRIKDIETNDKDFIMSISIFLEDFKRLAKEEKQVALEEEINGNVWSFEENAIIAATAEKLANDNDLKAPEWVNDIKYFLPNPIYEFETKNKDYQEFLINDAPKEFAKRNIFYGKNCLDRY